MEKEKSFIEFLSKDEYEQKAQKMIDDIQKEAKELNRPIYFGDGEFCYEQWSNGKKYVLLTDNITVSHP
jgi:hypothetical protein